MFSFALERMFPKSSKTVPLNPPKMFLPKSSENPNPPKKVSLNDAKKISFILQIDIITQTNPTNIIFWV